MEIFQHHSKTVHCTNNVFYHKKNYNIIIIMTTIMIMLIIISTNKQAVKFESMVSKATVFLSWKSKRKTKTGSSGFFDCLKQVW